MGLPLIAREGGESCYLLHKMRDWITYILMAESAYGLWVYIEFLYIYIYIAIEVWA